MVCALANLGTLSYSLNSSDSGRIVNILLLLNRYTWSVLSLQDRSCLLNFSITFIILLVAPLNNRSIPTTNGPPVLNVTLTPLYLFVIPSFKKLLVLNSNVFGSKAGSDHCDVALYSPSAYLYLYAKHINLSSK